MPNSDDPQDQNTPPESEPESEPKSEPGPEPESEPESEPKPEPEAVPKSEPQSAPQPGIAARRSNWAGGRGQRVESSASAGGTGRGRRHAADELPAAPGGVADADYSQPDGTGRRVRDLNVLHEPDVERGEAADRGGAEDAGLSSRTGGADADGGDLDRVVPGADSGVHFHRFTVGAVPGVGVHRAGIV